MIPNPTKTLVIKSSIDKVRSALDKLPTTLKQVEAGNYELKEKNELIDQYVFNKTEALSLGSNISIELIPEGENTKLQMEVSRVIGSFNHGYEVTNAMTHITNITKGLTWILNPTESTKEEMTKTHSLNQSGNSIMVVIYIITGLLMLGVIL